MIILYVKISSLIYYKFILYMCLCLGLVHITSLLVLHSCKWVKCDKRMILFFNLSCLYIYINRTNLTNKLMLLKNWPTFFFLENVLIVSWHFCRIPCMLISNSVKSVCGRNKNKKQKFPVTHSWNDNPKSTMIY